MLFRSFPSVIDCTTNVVLDSINVGYAPMGVSLTPDGNKLFVANSGSNTVNVINTSTNTVTDTITVGVGPGAFGNFISTYTSNVGIPELNTKQDVITIYPNPANTILNIHSQLSILNSQLLITDILGNEVYKETLNGMDNSIDISHWSVGVYFYQVNSDKGIVGKGKFAVIK